MTFDEVLDQVRELLQSKGRVAYRALKRRFALEDEYLEDLKAARSNGFCGHNRKPPIEEAIKRFCSQLE